MTRLLENQEAELFTSESEKEAASGWSIADDKIASHAIEMTTQHISLVMYN
jgi:hypothetical protein